jgi:epoxyqueuosine reductase
MSDVKRLASDLGFALCGVCDAAPSAHGEFFRRWLDEGRHGQMHWLAGNVDVRLDPRKLLHGAKSIICLADRIPDVSDGPAASTSDMGKVARYAHFTDYHKVIKKRLFRLADALRADHPDHQFRVCVDTAPLMEREHAARAGLGWVGKHTLLLNRELGSHLLLGAIVTTLGIEPDAPETDHCGTCRRCIDACPTDAISPWSVDASKCISYLTIEHRDTIDPEFHEPMGDWLFGCDICQDVCPYVNKARDTGAAQPRANAQGPQAPPYEPLPVDFDPREVIDWTEDDRRAAFRGSAMKRAKLAMIRRNAIIVATHRGLVGEDPALRARIEQLAHDPDQSELVRTTAHNCLRAIGLR